jgi:hypothetical protein
LLFRPKAAEHHCRVDKRALKHNRKDSSILHGFVFEKLAAIVQTNPSR